MAASPSKFLANQAGALALGRLLTVLSESLLMLFIVRILGKAEVGMFAAVLLVYRTVVLVARAGFPSATTFYVTGRPGAERRALATRIAQLLAGLGVVAGIVLALIAWFSAGQQGAPGGESMLVYLVILAPLPMLELPTRILPNLLVLEGRAQAAAGMNIVSSLGGNIALLVPIALGHDLWVAGGCMLIFGAVYCVLFLVYLRALYGAYEKVPCPVRATELLRYSVPLGMTDIIGVINSRIDRYLIMAQYAAERFAEYQVGAFQVPFITNVPYDVGTVLAPRLRTLFREGQAEQAIVEWRQSIVKVSLLVLPVTMVFLVGAEEFIGTLFPADYSHSAQVFRFYTVLSLGRVAAFGSVIAAAGAPGLVLYSSIIAIVSNVLLSVPLLFAIGFLGPALGTALAFIPMVVGYCYFIGRASGVPLRRVFPLAQYGRVLGLVAIAALPAVGIKLWIDGPMLIKFLAEGLVLLLGFGALGSWTGTIVRDDWEFLLGWAKLRRIKS